MSIASDTLSNHVARDTPSSSPKDDRAKPNFVTTYDILKTLAVLLMVMDHIGVYLFPYDLWWRAIGRLCVPIWFFLIGYAHRRAIGKAIPVGAFLLVAADYFFGRDLLPLNVLATMVLLRLGLDPVMRLVNQSVDRLAALSVFCILFFPLTNGLVEYGTLAVMFTVLGHMARHPWPKLPKIADYYGLFVLVFFVYNEQSRFHFSLPQDAIIALGSSLALTLLLFWLPKKEPGFAVTSPFLKAPLQFMGRHTLVIYVVHLVLFKAVYAALCQCHNGCLCYPFGIDPARLLH